MTKLPIQIAPGFVTEETARGARNRWKGGNRTRFHHGHTQKIGGSNLSAVSGDEILGAPRGAMEWTAIDNTPHGVFGTNLRLYHNSGGMIENITPYRLFTDEYGGSETELTDPFETTDTLTTVSVTHASHGAVVGDTVYFANATAVGGITIDGEYQITGITSGDVYTIEHSAAATSSATGGGTVDFAYEINVGASSGQAGLGYGIGPYGEGTYGTPRDSSDIIFPPRTWSHALWGEDSISNPRNGGIYYRDTSAAPPNRAAIVANAPAFAAFIIVSQLDRHLIALGTVPTGGSVRDPMVIRWCSQNDLTDWTVGRTNTAGERRLTSGSEIRSAIHARQQILIHTDTSCYVMTYIGPSPATFNIEEIGDKCGIVGPLANAQYLGRAYWMGESDFFVYDGSLSILDCPVHNHVFEDINLDHGAKFHAGTNSDFHEVWFFYCSAASDEIDRYVVYDPIENEWHFGVWDRTTWLDRSAVRSTPAAFDADGVLYDHESGYSENGAALGDYVETWDFQVPAGIDDGEYLMHISRIVPDFVRLSGCVEITLAGKKYPNATQTVTKGPFKCTATQPFFKPRLRARQISLKIASDTDIPESSYRLGQWSAEVRPAGKR